MRVAFLFKGRDGLGAIYTFAVGNGGNLDSCAYNGYVNSIYTITINGVNKDGSKPDYAEECAGILASTYSRENGDGAGSSIVRTDFFNHCCKEDECTKLFPNSFDCVDSLIKIVSKVYLFFSYIGNC